MTDTPRKSKLASQIETIIEPSPTLDALDPDLATYLNTFLTEFNQMEELAPIDLTSPESAREALKVLDAKKEELASKLKTARSLTRLLTASK